MIHFTEISKLQSFLKSEWKKGKTIGLVPTMGALHEGHLSLIKASKEDNDITVCTIFVNPTQFNNLADLAKYPRTVDKDCEMLLNNHCDVVFTPTVEEMYRSATELKISFGDLENVMEGAFRPGHFNGVGIVVAKFFNIIQPDNAYFGQKDLQQCAVIKRLVNDLSFQININICPTRRENDGLAMSSRNKNLTVDERLKAPIIFQILTEAKTMVDTHSLASIKNWVIDRFEKESTLKLEYFEIVQLASLQTSSKYLPNETAFCVAVFLGNTRLIDNIII
ncbi:MAG: pantoate--beta-alanine ligase [Pseudarcicella sp.]|nr:pantoate--beta-alanine ligase [Pseudarcicella sp.]MBP6409757.1 pantoate--beta-alanine ligase [Pseudarcicella sp.]